MTVTGRQIRALRQEAGEAGDLITVAICDVALATRLDEVAEIDESVRSDLEIMGIVPEQVGSDVAARHRIAMILDECAAAQS